MDGVESGWYVHHGLSIMFYDGYLFVGVFIDEDRADEG